MADRMEVDLIVKAIAEGFNNVTKEYASIGKSTRSVKKDLKELAQASLAGNKQMIETATRLANKYDQVSRSARKMAIEAAAKGNLKRASAMDKQANSAAKLARRFREASGEARKLGDASKKQGGAIAFLKKNWMGLVGILASARAAMVAVQKGVEFAEQGAAVRQTAESFDFLIKKIGLSENHLQLLRDAAKGTVDDMTLMSGTATLLAGTSDELGRALGQATPQLMEIAKAANKLNPSLGNTAFMYESIASGIKRSSTLILDNLGLTIKVGQANEVWAAKMGITVAAMTAENKQLALLEAAMLAGDKLIKQVGGTTESATDKINKMTSSMKNLTDVYKANFSEAVAPLIDIMNEYLDVQLLVASATEEFGIEMSGYRGSAVFVRYGEVVAETVDELEAYIQKQREGFEEVERYMRGQQQVTEATEESTAAIEEAAAASEKLRLKQIASAKAAKDGAASWDDLDRSISNTIINALKNIAFLEAGGQELIDAYDDIQQAIEDKVIVPSDAKDDLLEILLASESINIALGETTGWAAAEKIAKATHLEVREAYDLLMSMDGKEINAAVNVSMNIDQIYSGIAGATSYGGKSLSQFASGGYPRKGEWSVVGERGAELITPWGLVIPADKSRRMMQQGMIPKNSFAGGGLLLDPGDIGGGSTPTIKPAFTGAGEMKSGIPYVRPGLTGTFAPTYPGQIIQESSPAIESAIQESATTAATAAAVSAGSGSLAVTQQVNQSVKAQIAEGKKSLATLQEIRELLEELPVEIGQATASELEAQS